MPALLLNGVDAETYGFTLAEAPGWADAPAQQTPTTTVVGKPGLTALAGAQDQARKVTLRGTIRGASAAIARTNADNLKFALMASGLKLTFADHTDRYLTARFESFASPPMLGSLIQPALNVEAVLTADDPYFYDSALSGPLTLDATATHPIALGTAPSRPVITLTNAQVNPTLYLYNSAIALIGTLQLTATMLLGDSLMIDCAARTIKLNGVSHLEYLSAGDFFTLDPLVDLTPRIYLTTGAGSVTWRKAWR